MINNSLNDVLKLGLVEMAVTPQAAMPGWGSQRRVGFHHAFRLTDGLWHFFRYTDAIKSAAKDVEMDAPMMSSTTQK